MRKTILSLGGMVLAMSVLVACSDDGGSATDDLKQDAMETYAEGVHASYAASLASAQTMDVAIDAFVASPTQATLDAARQAWLAARDDYGPTEAFRFYGGPIDNEEDGPEGLINAWPLDEAYIDYVEGDPEAGIINRVDEFPEIDADVLLSLNEVGGETNIATGWHAIEFLLWGQDLSEDGPGDRPASDYVDAPNADRRGEYLVVATDLLLMHLQSLVDAWAPDAEGNYREEFLAMEPNDALELVITGIGEMSRGELGGERMTVAYEERSQEDEHSCFSDNTTNDIIANALGIQRVYLGQYPGVDGTGIYHVVQSVDEDLADRLTAELEASVAAARAIPAPFDQHLRDDVADSSEGRAAMLATIEALGTQTDSIVEAATAIGVTISVS